MNTRLVKNKILKNKTYWVLGNFDRYSFVSNGVALCIEEAIPFETKDEAEQYLASLDKDFKDAFNMCEGEIEVLQVNQKTEVSKL